MLNDDLSLDYDLGGLAVSASFILDMAVFIVLVSQVIITLYSLSEAYILHMCLGRIRI